MGFGAETLVIIVVFLCVWGCASVPIGDLTYSRINVNIGVNNSKKINHFILLTNPDHFRPLRINLRELICVH